MKRKYLIPGAICIAAGVVLLCFIFFSGRGSDIEGGPPDLPSNASDGGKTDPGSQENVNTSDSTSGEPSGEPYKSPVDFPLLQGKNPDVCGWIQIPGTSVTYPVLQSPTDDSFYLNHTIDGAYSDAGSLFTEHVYNSNTFDDTVTIIYGHYTWNGTFFGPLQETYSDRSTFDSCREIIIYMPDRELHYNVFAAVPYNNKHIMYKYDCFSSDGSLDAFLDSVYSVRMFGTNFDENCEVTEDDKILILSTCLNGNSQNRYLVLAKLIDTIS